MGEKHNNGRSDRAYAPRIGNAEEDKTYKFSNVFTPHAWQIAPLKYQGPILLLTGSAGGGKSRVAAEKIHGFCLRYKGATALIVRKTRTSMFNSVIAFMKSTVFGRMLKTGQITHNSTERRFEYWNGSVIVYGGMANEDQREAIRSVGQDGGVDIAWMEEAHQFEESDFNEIKARMRGNAAPWRQIILSTNPDAPTHWIYQRLIVGKEARVVYSKAQDNPSNPDDYQTQQLDTLQGIERKRLRDGKWAQAGGLVLDTFIDDYDNSEDIDNYRVLGNVRVSAEYIPGGGPVYWWVDDGYSGELAGNGKAFNAGSHPRVFLMVQMRGDGSLAIFAESYEVKMLAPAHIKKVIELHRAMRWAAPSRVIYDKSSPSLGMHLVEELREAWGVPASSITYNAVPVDDGNKEANTFLAPDKNQVRRTLVHPRCKFLRGELVTYKVNERTGRVVKDFDHGPDCIRMGVWDIVHGGPAEVDVAGINDVELPDYADDDFSSMAHEDYELYEHGNVSIAVLV
ncbi:MAG: phage terminase large subunit [Planctomycetota bacterium]